MTPLIINKQFEIKSKLVWNWSYSSISLVDGYKKIDGGAFEIKKLSNHEYFQYESHKLVLNKIMFGFNGREIGDVSIYCIREHSQGIMEPFKRK